MSNTDKLIHFAAIHPYIDSHIVSATETPARGGEYISWGDGNAFPDYCLDLFNRCATLRSVINGCVDYACGNGSKLAAGSLPLEANIVNRQGLTADDFNEQLARNYFLYGGFAFQVIRDRAGRVSELYPLDLRFLRTNAECEVFYYSENWRKKGDRVEYPAFMDDAQHPTSIVYVRNTFTQTYPTPLYGASLKACETEAAIDTYHLTNIENGFVSSLFVNFNNGQAATDEMREEIEREFCNKFSGARNGGRIGFSFNPDKDSATTFETFNIEDFGARYDALAKHCRQQIFTSFRANGNLFGIPTATGFSNEEYEAAFRLFNRTQIRPVQNKIKRAVGAALGNPAALTIEPFTLD